jgi:DNA-binding transcriptional LysR family regulator
MSLNLRHVRYFLAAARARQISRAAIDLNVSQSAVTAAIQQLEARLCAQLFERRFDGVQLTLIGERFCRDAERIISAVDDALQIKGNDAVVPKGKVSIGVTYTVCGYFFVPILQRLQRAHPEVTIQLREFDRCILERELATGGLDLAVMLTSNLANRDDLVHSTLLRSPRRLWTSATWFPPHDDRCVSLADVASLPYIALTVDEALETAMKYWQQTTFRPNVIFSTTSVEAVRTMVAGGMGISILSDLVYRPWSLEGQRVACREIIDPIPSMDVGVVWCPRFGISPAAAAVVEFLVRTARSDESPRGPIVREMVS